MTMQKMKWFIPGLFLVALLPACSEKKKDPQNDTTEMKDGPNVEQRKYAVISNSCDFLDTAVNELRLLDSGSIRKYLGDVERKLVTCRDTDDEQYYFVRNETNTEYLRDRKSVV